MKSMSEFVKEGREFIVGNKRRCISRRFGEIGHDADERTVFNTIPDALATEFRHPCAAPLACPREEVGIEKCKMFSVFILHVINLYILMIYRHIVKLLECNAVEAVGKVEDGIYTILKFEIWLKLLSIERVFSLLIALRPEREVPWHEFVLRIETVFDSIVPHGPDICKGIRH